MKNYQTDKEWLEVITSQLSRKKEKKTPQKTEQPKANAMAIAKDGGLRDIAGMNELKRLVTESFINVLKNKELAKKFGINPPSFLFYGPAGVGKTFFAEKVAEETGINFIRVTPDDLASSYIHGTQTKIGELFKEAEEKAPTLLFLDEFDAMVPRRSTNDENFQNGEVNEFLCMLNNANERGIYVMAATNHPERIDNAILRTERIDELIYVDLPDKEARESLFRLKLSKLPTVNNLNLSQLADMTKGFNCSDIGYIVQVASRRMFNESIAQNACRLITQEVLIESITERRPSVSPKDLREFERLKSEFSPKQKGVQSKGIGFH